VNDDIVARLDAEIGLIEAFGWEHDTRLLRDARNEIAVLRHTLKATQAQLLLAHQEDT
jgi:hypothetical protein